MTCPNPWLRNRSSRFCVVAIFCDGLLVGVVAAEAFLGIEAMSLTKFFSLLFEGVSGGNELTFDSSNFTGFEEISYGTGAAATAANDDAFELSGASGRILGEGGTGEDRGACQGAVAEERTTIQVIGIHDD